MSKFWYENAPRMPQLEKLFSENALLIDNDVDDEADHYQQDKSKTEEKTV